jgi:nitroimidazol reductase NimA-like FMN-containing flavoprotein (pyridoxamine 5'-phosphate oxidase superfamily)
MIRPMSGHVRLEELSRSECLALVRSTSVGRVGLSVQALPVVLPVNFATDGENVIFRTGPGTKLDAAVVGTVVAFEVDGVDTEHEVGWSVLIRGMAREVTDAEELDRARALPLRAWGQGEAADRYVRVAPELVSGRRVVAA